MLMLQVLVLIASGERLYTELQMTPYHLRTCMRIVVSDVRTMHATRSGSVRYHPVRLRWCYRALLGSLISALPDVRVPF